MKLSLSISFSILLIAMLSACATTPADKPKLSDSKNAALNTVAPRLTARDLGRGECGLFIWSADQERRFILFAQSQKGKAIWAGPSGETPLVITETSGQAFQEQYTQQSFAEETGSDGAQNLPALKLSLRNIEEVLDRTRFKGGTLSQSSLDGTQRVVPIVGLSTCR